MTWSKEDTKFFTVGLGIYFAIIISAMGGSLPLAFMGAVLLYNQLWLHFVKGKGD